MAIEFDTDKMENSTREGYQSFEIFLTDSEMDKSLKADRKIGNQPVNNAYAAGLVSVEANQSPKEIYPWFDPNNNEPEYLIKLLINNPVALGLLFTKCSVIHGQGLSLFRQEGDQKILLDFNDYPAEIQDFHEYNELNDWAYQSAIDHEILGNLFTHKIFSKGSPMINAKKRVVEMNRLAPECCRALRPSKGDIKEYVFAELWNQRDLKGYRKIPAYNHRNFFEDYKFAPGSGNYRSVLFHGKRNLPGFPIYAVPQWYGATKSIELQNTIPFWHLANILNMWGIRVRVSVSNRYIKEMCAKINKKTGKHYTVKEVKEQIRNILKDYTTNPANVGKIIVDTYYYDHGHKEPIKDMIIETIKLDIKDDAYVKMEPVMNSNVTSSFGVDPALASVITQKGMSSGSEKTQAWNILDALMSYTRSLILKPLRFAHRYNEWDSNLVWGFQNPSLVTKDIDKSGKTEPATKTPKPEDEDAE